MAQHSGSDKAVEPSSNCCLNGDQGNNREKPRVKEFQSGAVKMALLLQQLCACTLAELMHQETAEQKTNPKEGARSPQAVLPGVLS